MAPPVGQFECAEIISLLYHLDRVPASSSENTAPVSWSQPSQDQQHALSFDKERDFADMLAFLSSVEHDPDSITALCVHQDVKHGRLSVLVAMNAASSERSDSFLQKVKAGLERIFALLAHAAPGFPEGTDKVFDAIMTMCQDRILERLRLKRKRNYASRNHKAVVPLLQLTVGFLPEFRDYNERAHMLIQRIKEWSRDKTLRQLARVVDSTHHLAQLDNLDQLINTISNGDLDPCSRTNLINIVRKVARYRDCATGLHRLATKFPSVRNSKVKLVRLPRGAFQKSNIGERKPRIAATLSRLGISEKRQQQILDKYVQERKKDLCAVFEAQTIQTLSKGRIHAEIQLVYYCEVQNLQPPPRVICSNKDACFLCNEFLRMHAKFYTPRQHGRLYPGWRLPMFPQPREYEDQFVTLLEGLVRKSIAQLCQGNKARRQDPVESTLGLLRVSDSTLMPAAPSVGEAASCSGGRDGTLPRPAIVQPCQHSDLCEPMAVKDINALGMTTVMHETQETESGSSKAPENTRRSQQPSHISSTSVPPASASALVPSTARRSPTLLTRGVAHSGSVKNNSQPNIYEAWPLTLHIEYTTTAQLEPAKFLIYTLEWLGREASGAVRASQARVMDVDALHDVVHVEPQHLDGLYIAFERNILKLCVSD